MIAIRIIRTARGWSQTELALRAKIDRGTLVWAEQGKRTPSPRTLQRLSRALRVSVAALQDEGLARRILEQAKDCPEEPPSEDAARRYAARLGRIEAEEAKP